MTWRLERRGPAAVLLLDNPPRNFLTFEAFASLGKHLAWLGADPDVSVVVLGSAVPGYFAAHADLDELALIQDGPVPEARSWYSAMRAVTALPQPVVAVLDGQVWGGGLELALCCDLRIARPGTHLRLPEIDLGFIPGAGGTQRLLRLVGPGRAAELILSGRVLSSSEAAEWGVVTAADDPWELVDTIAAKPRAALLAAKQVLRDGAELPLKDGLKLEGGLFGSLLGTSEARSLVAAAREAYAAASPTEHVHV